MTVKIAPSILSADFGALAESIGLVVSGGADAIHVDVMDGHFVPNLTIGPPVVKALKKHCGIPLDVHLMIDNAEETMDWYLDAGADMLTVHVEACSDPRATLEHIRSRGALAGLSLNPGTPAEAVLGLLPHCDLVLVMSVNPGFGGQSFMPEVLPKLQALAAAAAQIESAEVLLSIDGGIAPETAAAAVGAGARMLVAGSAIFCEADPAAAVGALRAAGEAALE